MRAIRYEESLQSRFPEIASEWCSYKNDGLLPINVTPGSNKKVWWICSKGHEYLAMVAKRTNSGQGCPYCANVKVLTGYNDLATTHPDLLPLWDYEKNSKENIQPEKVLAGTDKKAWWICEHGHSYQMRIANKARGAGCPVCSSQIVTKDNCLATTNPELAQEWHPSKNGNLTPYDIISGSHRKVWWLCEQGHEWQAQPYSRLIHGCPVCDSEKRTSFPEQAILYYFSKQYHAQGRIKISNYEVDIFVPELKLAIEYDGSFYHQGEESENREKRKNSAIKSAGIMLIRVKEAKNEQCVLDNTIYCRYSQNYSFLEYVIGEICRIIYEKQGIMLSFDVNIQRDRSDIHSQYIRIKKENSLAIRKPLAAEKWDYRKNGKITPETVPAISKKRFWWKCTQCGYEWEGAVENIPNRVECPHCVHGSKKSPMKKNFVSKNARTIEYSLMSKYPEIANDWSVEKNGELTPNSVTPGSKQKVWWRCRVCGYEWQSTIKARTRFESHCPNCSKANQMQRRIQERGSFGELHPELVSQWDLEKNGSITPFMIAEKSKSTFWWNCDKGHSYEMSAMVKSRGTGCPICAGKRVHESNCLATIEPKLASWWDYEKNGDLLPTQVMPSSAREVWWKCPECNESFLRRLDVMRRTRKCKYCKTMIE